MKEFSTFSLYQGLLWIQAGMYSVSAAASGGACAVAVWKSAEMAVFSEQFRTVTTSGLHIEKIENRTLRADFPPDASEPEWVRSSRQVNTERALSVYVRRKWPSSFIEKLRQVSPKVATYSRWVNLQDSAGEPVGGVSLVTSESLCMTRQSDGATRCSGAWSDFERVLVDSRAWDDLEPIKPLALEILYPGVRVPRLAHRDYQFEGYSFAFGRVYELRHYFLRKHPLREEAKQELTFAVVEWLLRDFSNDGDDLFRWPPPGFQIPSIFSYGDEKSIALYGPLGLLDSHRWAADQLDGWTALSATPLEMVDAIFLWPHGGSPPLLQSADNRLRFKKLRERYFPSERHFVHSSGLVLRSDIFEVRHAVLKQSGMLSSNLPQ